MVGCRGLGNSDCDRQYEFSAGDVLLTIVTGLCTRNGPGPVIRLFSCGARGVRVLLGVGL